MLKHTRAPTSKPKSATPTNASKHAESFQSESHLNAILGEAQEIVNNALARNQRQHHESDTTGTRTGPESPYVCHHRRNERGEGLSQRRDAGAGRNYTGRKPSARNLAVGRW
jgi:hypothetical protein